MQRIVKSGTPFLLSQKTAPLFATADMHVRFYTNIKAGEVY
jgi:hypothetical protein